MIKNNREPENAETPSCCCAACPPRRQPEPAPAAPKVACCEPCDCDEGCGGCC